jgi:hypothetical protein
MHEAVFRAVACESQGRRGCTPTLHRRVHELVVRWLESPAGAQIPFANTADAFETQVRNCSRWVTSTYRSSFGVPLLGLLLWPILSGIISWLVQRTLEQLFPCAERQGCVSDTGGVVER